MALTTTEILYTLDHCDDETPFNFITLNHPYVYLIDSRLNVYRNYAGKWAIVSEVLGFNPRGGVISLELYYLGNCIRTIKTPQDTVFNNWYTVFPIDFDSQIETTDGEALMPDAVFWLIRGKQIPLSHDKRDYLNAQIELRGYAPGGGEIKLEEVGRLMIRQYQALLRASDEELLKYLPDDFQKVLVIDEWYHKGFSQSAYLPLRSEYINNLIAGNPEMREIIESDLQRKREWDERQWQDRPSSYETWQQIAEVIVSGDPSLFKPTIAPNSHWKNWPESGSM